MEEIILFFKIVVAMSAGGATIFGFYYYIKRFIDEKKMPRKELAEKVAKLEQENTSNKNKIDDLEKELKEYIDDRICENDETMEKLRNEFQEMKEKIDGTQAEIRLILTSQLAIGNHLIAEGSKNAIKEANEDIVKHLINKQ